MVVGRTFVSCCHSYRGQCGSIKPQTNTLPILARPLILAPLNLGHERSVTAGWLANPALAPNWATLRIDQPQTCPRHRLRPRSIQRNLDAAKPRCSQILPAPSAAIRGRRSNRCGFQPDQSRWLLLQANELSMSSDAKPIPTITPFAFASATKLPMCQVPETGAAMSRRQRRITSRCTTLIRFCDAGRKHSSCPTGKARKSQFMRSSRRVAMQPCGLWG